MQMPPSKDMLGTQTAKRGKFLAIFDRFWTLATTCNTHSRLSPMISLLKLCVMTLHTPAIIHQSCGHIQSTTTDFSLLPILRVYVATACCCLLAAATTGSSTLDTRGL